jgi:hypothetical protein
LAEAFQIDAALIPLLTNHHHEGSMSTKQKHLTLKQLLECIQPAFVLRKNNAQNGKVIEEYARLMKEGTEFPPVIVGTTGITEWNPTGKLLVDGYLRVYAAEVAGLKSLPVEEVAYEGETPKDAENLALADMLRRNMGRGKDVTAAERDTRIKELSRRRMKNKQIAQLVNLTEASISRIIRGLQKEGQAGKANEGKTHESRVARGTATEQRVKEAIGTVPGFYEALRVIPIAVTNGAELLLTSSTVQHVGIIEAAMLALKGLHDDLVKHLHLARPSKMKKAA